MTILGVVIVTYQSASHIAACLSSLRDQAGIDLRTIIIDNASHDATVAQARRTWPDVHVVENATNVGFSRANNQGVEALGDVPFILFLNPDTELRRGALAPLLDALRRRNDLGAVGPLTLEGDGSVQLSFGPDLSPLAEWRQKRRMEALRRKNPAAVKALQAEVSRPFNPDWLSGSCLLVRGEAFRQVGGFDEQFFLYEEDADLCLRLRQAGWKLGFIPPAVVVHHQGRSVAGNPYHAALAYQEGHLRYYEKHNGWLANLVLRVILLARGCGAYVAGDPARRPFGAQLRRLALTRNR